MDSTEPYRGVAFSINECGEKRWRWVLHPPIEFTKDMQPVESGVIVGTHGEAVAAARQAIDRALDKR